MLKVKNMLFEREIQIIGGKIFLLFQKLTPLFSGIGL